MPDCAETARSRVSKTASGSITQLFATEMHEGEVHESGAPSQTAATTGHPSAAPLLLFDELECGASTDRELRHTSVLSRAGACGASAETPAFAAVRESPLESTVFAPSIIYRAGDLWITLLERFSLLPAVPVSGSGHARYQPIWARDVAHCVVAALDGGSNPRGNGRYELAGPELLSYDDIVEVVVEAAGRERPLVHVPLPLVHTGLRALELLIGPSVFATWEEAELMEVPMTSERGTADAEQLGVEPRAMGAVLGARA